MKTKIGISLVLMLLMVASTFTTVNAIQTEKNELPSCPPGWIDFTKSVWDSDSQSWVDYIENVEVGYNARFNISLTYHKNPGNPCQWTLHHIVISDILPDCLDFADNAAFFNAPIIEEEIVDNVVTWNFTASGHALQDGQTMSIEFDATVVQSEETENENVATVTASECNIYPHSGEDSAWVYVYVPPPVEVIKEVYDPETGQWVDQIYDVKKSVPVEFKITITYVGYDDIDLMKCMIVEDKLPECCLEYISDSEVFTYPNEELFEDPDINVEDLKNITYDWSDKKFNLYRGEAIIIQFKASVVEYCYATVENCAYVDMWSCVGCPYPIHIYGSDCATVNCYPPESKFEKKVWNDEGWADEGLGIVGKQMTFKLEFVYYGNEVYTDASFKDELPCVLEFSEVVESTINITVDVSDDKKTIWFNMSEDTIADGDDVIIKFTADVTGVTGDCCPDPVNNKAFLFVYLQEYYDEVSIKTIENHKPCPPIIGDNAEGQIGEEITFWVRGGDPDEDNVYYYIDWGDGTFSEWLGPYASGEIQVTHKWTSAGEYKVKAKAKDTWDEEGPWGNELTVKIEGNAVDITIKHISRGIKVTLKNNLETDINGVQWSIEVNKRIFGKNLLDKNGTIETLTTGTQTTIHELTKFRFGLVSIKVTVVIAPDIEPIVKTAKGLILGKFVFLRYTK
jgi:fimbrial isopeptide formation D2 family protein